MLVVGCLCCSVVLVVVHCIVVLCVVCCCVVCLVCCVQLRCRFAPDRTFSCVSPRLRLVVYGSVSSRHGSCCVASVLFAFAL